MGTAADRFLKCALTRAAAALAWACLMAAPLWAQNADSLALVALYNATSGQSWTNNAGWLTEPLHMWHGITVDSGRVVGLVLPNNDLRRAREPNESGSGVLPPELGNLGALRTLDLSDNRLLDSAPTEVANMSAISLDFQEH